MIAQLARIAMVLASTMVLANEHAAAASPRESLDFPKARLGPSRSLSSLSTVGHDRRLRAGAGTRIVGGDVANKFQHDHFVSLYTDCAGDSSELCVFCGGSLIADTIVLTAATCLAGNAPSIRKVCVGDYIDFPFEAVDGAECFEPKSTVLHPDYGFTANNLINDLAMIQLPTPSTKKPVELSLSKTTDAPVLTEASIVGHGKAFDEGSGSFTCGFCGVPCSREANCRASETSCDDVKCYENDYDFLNAGADSFGGPFAGAELREVKLSLRPAQECDALLQELQEGDPFFGSQQICAGKVAEEAVCQFDFGGPLTYIRDGTRLQIGIASFSFLDGGCGVKAQPSVFTRISLYQEWVVKTMESLQAPGDEAGSGIGLIAGIGGGAAALVGCATLLYCRKKKTGQNHQQEKDTPQTKGAITPASPAQNNSTNTPLEPKTTKVAVQAASREMEDSSGAAAPPPDSVEPEETDKELPTF